MFFKVRISQPREECVDFSTSLPQLATFLQASCKNLMTAVSQQIMGGETRCFVFQRISAEVEKKLAPYIFPSVPIQIKFSPLK